MLLSKFVVEALGSVWFTAADYALLCGFEDGVWGGDSCGCPHEVMCRGVHHDPENEECRCFLALLDEFRAFWCPNEVIGGDGCTVWNGRCARCDG